MITWWEILVRMVVSALLGGVIGWEREVQHKPAGLRTMMLVSLSSATFVLGATQASVAVGEPLDAVRAMAGIAQGIGFLGAGAIMQSKNEVRWLTTAAALWAAAGIGFATGIGSYVVAAAAAVLTFAVLRWLGRLADRWFSPTHDGPAVKDQN